MIEIWKFNAIAEYSPYKSTATRLDSSLIYRHLSYGSLVMRLASVNYILQLPEELIYKVTFIIYKLCNFKLECEISSIHDQKVNVVFTKLILYIHTYVVFTNL